MGLALGCHLMSDPGGAVVLGGETRTDCPAYLQGYIPTDLSGFPFSRSGEAVGGSARAATRE